MIMNYLKDNGPMFAFNIWDIHSTKAVLDAAGQKQKRVILQTSSNIFSKMNIKQLREFVDSYTYEKGIQAWLHLDHCKEIELIKKAIDYGWDSVMLDASDRVITENIFLTNEIVEYAHRYNVLVEAEVGQIKGTEDNIEVKDASVARREDIDLFVKEAKVDMLAVAFGNAHGIYQGIPDLRYDLVEYTVEKTDVPFVVHGGSGLSVQELKRLLAISNVKKINISTDLKCAYREGILQAYKEGFLEKSGFQPIKVEKCIYNQIFEKVCEKLSVLDE